MNPGDFELWVATAFNLEQPYHAVARLAQLAPFAQRRARGVAAQVAIEKVGKVKTIEKKSKGLKTRTSHFSSKG
jgi:hypothetical protein